MIDSLSLAVWDINKRRGLSLKEQLDMFGGRETVLYTASRIDGVRYDVFFLSFSECAKPILKLAQMVRRTGEDVFLLLVSRRGSDITPLFRPMIRPSGVLFHPVQNSDIRDILCEIVSEIKRVAGAGNDDVFTLKSDGVSYRIAYRDILFFEASNKKVMLHTVGQQIGYYDSIENLAGVLPDYFLRCHRSYLVNIKKVEEIRGSDMELKLTGGYRIPISRSYKKAVQQATLNRS